MGQAEQAQSVSGAADAKRAAEILARGGVVAFPTETVYGLGADASNAAAVRRVFVIKGRPATNPVIVHVADVEQAMRCVRGWPAGAEKLAERFWPGPLTIVLPKSDVIAPEVTAGGDTVGVRVPDHPVALGMLNQFARLGGVGVAAPSANRSSHVSPTTAQHVRDDLGATGTAPQAPDLILDGGPCMIGIESTVISLATPVPTVLRPGGISVEALCELLGDVQIRGGSDVGPAASPGRQQRHYAPRAKVIVFTGEQRGRVPATSDKTAILALSPLERPAPRKSRNIVDMPNNPARYAEHFYRILRELDAQGAREVWIELPPDMPQWRAVRDRIMRASWGETIAQ